VNWRSWTPTHWLIATGVAVFAGVSGYEVWKHYKKSPEQAPTNTNIKTDDTRSPKPVSSLTISSDLLCSAIYESLPKDPRVASDGTRLPSIHELVQIAIQNSSKTSDPFSLNNAADVIDASIRDLGLDPKYAKASQCLRDQAEAMPAAPVGFGSPGSLLFPTDKSAGVRAAGIRARIGRR
jgi:hypothetical protein